MIPLVLEKASDILRSHYESGKIAIDDLIVMAPNSPVLHTALLLSGEGQLGNTWSKLSMGSFLLTGAWNHSCSEKYGKIMNHVLQVKQHIFVS